MQLKRIFDHFNHGTINFYVSDESLSSFEFIPTLSGAGLCQVHQNILMSFRANPKKWTFNLQKDLEIKFAPLYERNLSLPLITNEGRCLYPKIFGHIKSPGKVFKI